MNIQKDNFFIVSFWKQQILCLVHQKKELHGNNFLLTNSKLTTAKFTTFTKIDITLQTNLRKFRAATICSIITLDWRYDNSIITVLQILGICVV